MNGVWRIASRGKNEPKLAAFKQRRTFAEKNKKHETIYDEIIAAASTNVQRLQPMILTINNSQYHWLQRYGNNDNNGANEILLTQRNLPKYSQLLMWWSTRYDITITTFCFATHKHTPTHTLTHTYTHLQTQTDTDTQRTILDFAMATGSYPEDANNLRVAFEDEEGHGSWWIKTRKNGQQSGVLSRLGITLLE